MSPLFVYIVTQLICAHWLFVCVLVYITLTHARHHTGLDLASVRTRGRREFGGGYYYDPQLVTHVCQGFSDERGVLLARAAMAANAAWSQAVRVACCVLWVVSACCLYLLACGVRLLLCVAVCTTDACNCVPKIMHAELTSTFMCLCLC